MEKYLWARWTVIIITWIVTSFACHQLGKIFLQRSASVLTAYQLDNEPTLFMLATFLTIVQMMSCVLLASSNRHHSKDTDYSETPSAAYRIAIAGHILCTLLTNWSLTRMDVATMLTLKMAEPIYTAIALRWCTDERLGCAMWWSVLLVVGDALFFTLDGTQIQEMTTLGLVLVMMSNEVVALRNLAIKQLHISGVAVPMVQWHRFYLLAFMMAVAFFFLDALEFRCYVPKDSAVAMAVLCLSSIFHVIYSVISTWVMLNALGMMSHALACVGKRVLVVNLFYRQRTMTRDLLIMLVGLCLALFVRARLALQSGTDHHTETTNKETVVETEECKTIQCYVIQLPEEQKEEDNTRNTSLWTSAIKYKWQFLNVSGSKPIPRSSHSLNVVNGTVYVMGGEHKPRVPIGSEVWSLDVTAAKWQQLETKGVEVPPRNAHASAVVGSSIFIFGGRHGIAMGEGAMNDMYELDTTTATWKQVSSSGDIPPPRSYHSMTAIGSTLYVFGGCGTDGRHNDLHSFDTNTRTWQALPTFDPILPRGGTGFVAIGCNLYVVGGFTGQEMSDVYEFDTESSRWRQVKAVPVLPARSVFGIAALGSRIFVVGGEVDPSTQGHAGAGEFSKDVYVLDTEDEGEGWQKAEPADDAIFTERGWLPAAALDASRIITFGGIALDNSRSDETYILHVGK